MKKWTTLFALAALVGCGAPNEQGILITEAIPLKVGGTSGVCTRETLQQGGGLLDISGAGTYLMSFDIVSQLTSSTTLVNGEPLDGETESTLVINTIELSYESDPALSIPSGTHATHFIAGSDSYIIANLLTSEAAAALLAGVPPGSSVDLTVSMRLSGQTLGGTNMASNRIQYPITVFNSGFAGCGSSGQAATGPCGTLGGQDGTAVACCSDPAYSSSCG